MTHSTAFSSVLTNDEVRHNAPAIFATSAHEQTSRAYTFLSTERLLNGLQQAGFLPINVRQTKTRSNSALHARHLIRLRRRYETIQLRDAIPEIILINSHDGTTAYQLRFGLFRVVCTNGLIVSTGSLAAFRVPHRGNVVDDIVQAALDMTERFATLGDQVERMEKHTLNEGNRRQLAQQALRLRYEDAEQNAMQASELLIARRSEDQGNDLWRTYNVIQENLLTGGLTRRAGSGRRTRTRRLTSIREDVRINSGLWDLAAAQLVA